MVYSTQKTSLALFISSLLHFSAHADTDENPLFSMSLEQLQNVKISSTASLFSESLDEAPAPITVITSEMIKRSGVKSIKDILLRYVPGMHYVQDSGEQVIAMRGVYASSQQKILFLLNGVRLNQRVLSAQDPDHSLSLNKLERIEVVRGPSSSIYGNSALTGVINLITKSGTTHQGLSVTVASGSYGLKKANLEFGKELEEGEIYAWGQYFQTDGEKINLSPEENWSANVGNSGSFYIDRFRNVPSHDIGAQIKIENWTLLMSDGAAKYSKPFSSFGDIEGQTYDINDYREIDRIQPGGTKMYHRHLSLKHESKALGLDWINNIYTDRSGVVGTGVADPDDQSSTGYKVRKFEFSDKDFGLISYAGKEYSFLGYDGNTILGMQYEEMKSEGGSLEGYNTADQANIDISKFTMLLPGKEKQYALFLQSKQRYSDNLVANIGVRYDKKYRRNDTHTIENISSRVSLSYNVNNAWNVKGVYAESFVDAPYFYRYNQFEQYQGSTNLEPELLNSTQLSVIFSGYLGLTSTTNIFYNNLDNFIFFNIDSADPDQKVFNSGEMITWGLENETVYRADTWSVSFNATYLSLVSHKNVPVIDDKIRDVPSVWFNIIMDKEFSDKISGNLHIMHVGSQHSPISSTAYLNGELVADPNNVVSGKTIINLNAQYNPVWLNKLELGLNISNVFDTTHFQGGTVQHPYQQPGRWWSLSASYLFD